MDTNKINTITNLFEEKEIRSVWNSEKEEYYFSVIDVISALTDSKIPKRYWTDLKNKLTNEGSELYENIVRLKMRAQDGKLRETDTLDTKGIFRLIESVPSPKAEPFKLWLARVGKERIDETYDPEITINRALETYRRKGYSEEWINQRLKTIDVRKEFTDELQRSGINSQRDFAILTNVLTQTWSGYSVKEYKNLKGLKKENLRDNMTNMELVLNMLAETSSTEISKGTNPNGFDESKKVVIQGGTIAKIAKEQLEKETGKKIVSNKNAAELRSEKKRLMLEE